MVCPRKQSAPVVQESTECCRVCEQSIEGEETGILELTHCTTLRILAG